MEDKIKLYGMRENNLKNVDLVLPKNKIIVFTGLSGSGKSSVVFDTIARESKRQMTKDFSSYERRHMKLYKRPDLDRVENLSPAIVVKQSLISSNSRSDIASYMDIGPMIRLLYSRIAKPRIKEASDFSKYSSFGTCPNCDGNGLEIDVDINKLVDFDKSLADYAVRFAPLSPSQWQGRWMMTCGLFDPDLAIKDYKKKDQDLFLYGPEGGGVVLAPFHTKNGDHKSWWDGLIPRFERLYVKRDISNLNSVSKEEVLSFCSYKKCKACLGTGLNKKVLEAKIEGKNIAEVYNLELDDLLKFLKSIKGEYAEKICQQIIPIVEQLIDIGLGYLSLSRQVSSLSGGEGQRLKIASKLGSSLNNMCYIFDEPSAGLHPLEVSKINSIFKKLKENFNTVMIVEHNQDIIKEADLLVELGPYSGKDGGKIVFEGKFEDMKDTATSKALKEKEKIKISDKKFDEFYEMSNITSNNLKNISIKIPKNSFTGICGVSGSGKSSLIGEFYKKYNQALFIDQKEIGKSKRSNLATYMGIMDKIREVFAKENNVDMGLFSFNSKGACPICKGKGFIEPDVAYSDPIKIICEGCKGDKYSSEAKSYKYKGLSIVDVLDMTAKEARNIFDSKMIDDRLDLLEELGLSYLCLGQTTNTLSGGELQRLKLASSLRNQGEIYIFDEPTRGLHPLDIDNLLKLLNSLVENKNTVIVIEHEPKLLLQLDWILELGPDAGKNGGELIYQGYLRDFIDAKSKTSKYLKGYLNK